MWNPQQLKTKTYKNMIFFFKFIDHNYWNFYDILIIGLWNDSRNLVSLMIDVLEEIKS